MCDVVGRISAAMFLNHDSHGHDGEMGHNWVVGVHPVAIRRELWLI